MSAVRSLVSVHELDDHWLVKVFAKQWAGSAIPPLPLSTAKTIMLNRRHFLISTAAASGAVATQASFGQVASANESLGLGFIGLGWRGGQLVDACG